MFPGVFARAFRVHVVRQYATRGLRTGHGVEAITARWGYTVGSCETWIQLLPSRDLERTCSVDETSPDRAAINRPPHGTLRMWPKRLPWGKSGAITRSSGWISAVDRQADQEQALQNWRGHFVVCAGVIVGGLGCGRCDPLWESSFFGSKFIGATRANDLDDQARRYFGGMAQVLDQGRAPAAGHRPGVFSNCGRQICLALASGVLHLGIDGIASGHAVRAGPWSLLL